MANKFSKFQKGKPKGGGIDSERWKVVPCPEGKKCWCRMIKTAETDSIVIPAAVIRKDLADYIVKLQNERFR